MTLFDCDTPALLWICTIVVVLDFDSKLPKLRVIFLSFCIQIKALEPHASASAWWAFLMLQNGRMGLIRERDFAALMNIWYCAKVPGFQIWPDCIRVVVNWLNLLLKPNVELTASQENNFDPENTFRVKSGNLSSLLKCQRRELFSGWPAKVKERRRKGSCLSNALASSNRLVKQSFDMEFSFEEGIAFHHFMSSLPSFCYVDYHSLDCFPEEVCL